ncbi:hypothetical protein D3C81_1973100 [compost metagenome]
MWLCRLLHLAAGIGHAVYGQASRIEDREGWRVGVQVGAVHVAGITYGARGWLLTEMTVGWEGFGGCQAAFASRLAPTGGE